MKKLFYIFVILTCLFFTGCFSEKDSVFYDSEWIMKNYDAQGQLYYHHLILQPKHKVMLRASYADSTNIMVWVGKYKINSRKIDFDFTECLRYENGEIVGKYTAGKLIKYYAGDFFYSVAALEAESPSNKTDKTNSANESKSHENEAFFSDAKTPKQYHLELIRPKNFFYGKNIDIFGNPLEEFIKVK